MAEGRIITVTGDELKMLLREASREGAKEAVEALLGIEDHERFKKDLIELRDLVNAWRLMRRGAWSGLGRLLVYGLLLLIALVVVNFGHIPSSWSLFH